MSTTSKLGADMTEAEINEIAAQIYGTQATEQEIRFARALLARQPAAIDKQEASSSPFSNCKFRECDLPGQCRGEGACHHPRDAAPLDKGASKPAAATAFDHLDDIAIDQFAVALKAKLAASRAKGRGGWEQCDPAMLSNMLREHVEKGDPRDVANFCMFLWWHKAAISSAAPSVAQDEPVVMIQGRFVLEADPDFPDLPTHSAWSEIPTKESADRLKAKYGDKIELRELVARAASTSANVAQGAAIAIRTEKIAEIANKYALGNPRLDALLGFVNEVIIVNGAEYAKSE
jgi:hypothetical protein